MNLQDSFHAVLKWQKKSVYMKRPPYNIVNTSVEALIAASVYIVLRIKGNWFSAGEQKRDLKFAFHG